MRILGDCVQAAKESFTQHIEWRHDTVLFNSFPWANPMACIIEIATLSRCFICISLKVTYQSAHFSYQIVPGTRRGGSFEKLKQLYIGRRWPIGKFLRCRSSAVLKLWENEPLSQWLLRSGWNDMKESMRSWLDESMNQWIDKSRANERIDESVNRWRNEAMNQWIRRWINQSMNQGISEPMKQRSSEPKQWTNESMNEWSSESMNEWINEQKDQWIN